MSTDYAVEKTAALHDDSRNDTSRGRGVGHPLRQQFDPAPPSTLVIFGITGDLSHRKLVPAIYDLAHRRLLPDDFSLVGFARCRNVPTETVVDTLRDSVIAHTRLEFDEQVWSWLAPRLHLVDGHFDNTADFERLKDIIDTIGSDSTADNCCFYMSIAPTHFDTVSRQLRTVGLHRSERGWRRLVVEKPFGRNLATAAALEHTIAQTFDHDSIYRVDHYLGKETVQNILALRLANSMFEPLWNNRHIDHVQITMAEDIGVEGRAGYYDGVGAARDIIQNHLLQLLALIAMEEPLDLTAAAIAGEKVKVLGAASATTPFDATTARGQYTVGVDSNGKPVAGLVEENGFDPRSTTETYAALTVEISNRRWAGVPFYLRAGKRLPRRFAEIAVTFTAPTHHVQGFTPGAPAGNVLVFRVQPNDGISLHLSAKQPGDGMTLASVELDLTYPSDDDGVNRDAYERLILDVLRGDLTLFPTRREIELSWAIVDPVIEQWSSHGRPAPYPAGSSGPGTAEAMTSRTGRRWRPIV